MIEEEEGEKKEDRGIEDKTEKVGRNEEEIISG